MSATAKARRCTSSTASGDWSPHAAADGPNGTAVFDLTGLEAGTRYGVRASLDGTLPYKDWLTTDRFETNRSLRYGPDYLVSAPTGNGGYELSWG